MTDSLHDVPYEDRSTRVSRAAVGRTQTSNETCPSRTIETRSSMGGTIDHADQKQDAIPPRKSSAESGLGTSEQRREHALKGRPSKT